MKKLFLFLFILLIPAIAFSETIQLEWDYTADDQTNIDGFRLYMRRLYTEEYDYTNPVATIPPEYRNYQIDAEAGEDTNRTYSFVIRAYKGDEESTDSNEVNYLVVGIKPAAPIELTGEYNKETSILNLNWEQPQDDFDIWKWIVYYRIDDDTEFIELGTVDKGQALTLVKDFNVVEPGQSKTVHFTVVAFRRDYTVHSENAAEFSIVIDRQGPPVPPDNLKINIEIPVL